MKNEEEGIRLINAGRKDAYEIALLHIKKLIELPSVSFSDAEKLRLIPAKIESLIEFLNE